jgi:murein DD-endopeptidase MepM/ murein hydrolase activator NlpD
MTLKGGYPGFMNSCRGLFLISLLAVVAQGCASSRPADRARVVPSGWPVARDSAVITSNFGAPRGGSRHEGIDLSAPAGTQVRSTADGVVDFAGRSGDFGRLVVIDHGDGWQTRYAHLKKIRVKKGKRVARGMIVGTVGKSGNATGYHLHYEIRRHGRAVDPRPSL